MRTYTPRRPYTDEEDNFLRAHNDMTFTDLAKSLHRSVGTIKKRFALLDLKHECHGYNMPWSEKDTELLMELYPSTHWDVLVKTFNRTKGAIQNKAVRLDLERSIAFKHEVMSKPHRKFRRSIILKHD